jgi:phage terminase small subunit
MADLTEKQEAFCLAFFETGNAAEAYRRAYDVEPDAKNGWIYVEACQLLDNPKIALRLQDLRDQAQKLSIYTVRDALDEYDEARILAKAANNPSAVVAAVTGKVKLLGLDQPRKVAITGKDGGAIQTEDVTAAAILKAKLDEIASRTAGTAAPE